MSRWPRVSSSWSRRICGCLWLRQAPRESGGRSTSGAGEFPKVCPRPSNWPVFKLPDDNVDQSAAAVAKKLANENDFPDLSHDPAREQQISHLASSVFAEQYA